MTCYSHTDTCKHSPFPYKLQLQKHSCIDICLHRTIPPGTKIHPPTPTHPHPHTHTHTHTLYVTKNLPASFLNGFSSCLSQFVPVMTSTLLWRRKGHPWSGLPTPQLTSACCRHPVPPQAPQGKQLAPWGEPQSPLWAPPGDPQNPQGELLR